MLSAPKTPPRRCPDGCDCRICRDVHVLWTAALNPDRAGGWQAVDRQDLPQPAPPEPAGPPDVHRFTADTAAITAQLRDRASTADTEETPT
jgi:hypothetical protein